MKKEKKSRKQTVFDAVSWHPGLAKLRQRPDQPYSPQQAISMHSICLRTDNRWSAGESDDGEGRAIVQTR